MKVIMNFAPTVNGKLNRGKGDDYSWISQESWDDYKKTCQQCGCVIMGRGTYDLMAPQDFYPGVFYVILTHDASIKNRSSEIVFSSQEPEGVLKMLEEKGYRQACLGGGSRLALSFFKKGLVDEICYNIEPRIFGEGLPMIFPEALDIKLELLEVRKLNNNTIHVHYKVIK
jgi:dihydrofolate reductase